MKTKVLTILALLAALYPCRAVAQTLNDPSPALPERAIELSFNYSTLRTNAPVGGCGCFWTNGGSVELAVPLWRYVSSVAEFSGEHSGSIPGNSGVGLNLISALGGVRVTRPLNKRFIPYAQGLVGVVHAFDSSFPGALGTTPSATSFALAAGGGLELASPPLARPARPGGLSIHATSEQHGQSTTRPPALGGNRPAPQPLFAYKAMIPFVLNECCT